MKPHRLDDGVLTKDPCQGRISRNNSDKLAQTGNSARAGEPMAATGTAARGQVGVEAQQRASWGWTVGFHGSRAVAKASRRVSRGLVRAGQR